jgi:hypothetical protein
MLDGRAVDCERDVEVESCDGAERTGRAIGADEVSSLDEVLLCLAVDDWAALELDAAGSELCACSCVVDEGDSGGGGGEISAAVCGGGEVSAVNCGAVVVVAACELT